MERELNEIVEKIKCGELSPLLAKQQVLDLFAVNNSSLSDLDKLIIEGIILTLDIMILEKDNCC